jgi:hypothetical protein
LFKKAVILQGPIGFLFSRKPRQSLSVSTSTSFYPAPLPTLRARNKIEQNSTTPKLGVQERNVILLPQINNAPILKNGIFPSSECGDFTLFGLW